MSNLDTLEYGGGRGFAIRYQGQVHEIDSPRDMGYQDVLICLQNQVLPNFPEGPSITALEAAFDRWRISWDLPDFDDAYRLVYMADNHYQAMAYDLHTRGIDLGTWWRQRRWQDILNIIDHLPSHSWFSTALSLDEEYARVAAEAMAGQKQDAEPSGPHMTTWTPEVAAIVNLTDAVRSLEHTVVAVQAGKAAGKPPEPLQRPKTAMEMAVKRASFAARKAKHDALVARVLPKKAPPENPVH